MEIQINLPDPPEPTVTMTVSAEEFLYLVAALGTSRSATLGDGTNSIILYGKMEDVARDLRPNFGATRHARELGIFPS